AIPPASLPHGSGRTVPRSAHPGPTITEGERDVFGRLAHLMYRRRRAVVGAWLAILIVAGALASQVGSVLGPASLVTSGSDSAKAAALLDTSLHQNDQKVTLVVIHDPRAGMHVAYLDNPLVSGNRQLISTDGHSVAILLSSNLKEVKIEDQIAHLRQVARTPGLDTYVTGSPAANYDQQKAGKDDAAKGDAETLPILIAILLLAF